MVYSVNLLHVHNGMEIIKFKFKASQARSIYQYKKLKIKVLKCKADIFFKPMWTMESHRYS